MLLRRALPCMSGWVVFADLASRQVYCDLNLAPASSKVTDSQFVRTLAVNLTTYITGTLKL